MDCDVLQVKQLFLNIIDNISEYDDFDKELRKMSIKIKVIYLNYSTKCISQ